MSIFSGFPTRKLEDRYNALIKDTLNMLMQVIITYVDRDKISPFEQQFKKIFTSFEKLDAMKHAETKISLILKPLANHIYCLDDSQILSEAVTEPKDGGKRRPLTSNYVIKEQRKNNQEAERKTINLATQLDRRYNNNRYPRGKRYSLSVKNSSEPKKPFEEMEISPNITMEQLMEKNRLVERKMSLFRKKRFLQQGRIGRIQEEEGEEQDISFN